MEKSIQLVGRVFLAHMFILAGLSKVSAYAGTQQYMEAMGVPGVLLPMVILLEVVGGFALLLGWQTKIAAAMLAVFSIVAAIVFHANFADQMQMVMFMKNISIAGGLLMLVSYGAGAYGLDNRNTKPRISKGTSDTQYSS